MTEKDIIIEHQGTFNDDDAENLKNYITEDIIDRMCSSCNHYNVDSEGCYGCPAVDNIESFFDSELMKAHLTIFSNAISNELQTNRDMQLTKEV